MSRTLARPVSGATRIGRRSAAGPGATFGILAGFMVAGAVGAALLSVHLHQVSGANSPSPYGRATHAVIFVVDGAGSQSLPLDRMPNLSGLAHTGTTYSNAWVGQMMATPAASGATIATGVFPRKHGVVADQWLDPRSHQIVRPTSGDAVLVGSLDAVMEPRGVTPIASVIKSRMPRSRVLSVGGTNCAAAAAAGTWVADYIVCAARRARNWVPVTVAGHALPSGAAGALNLRAPVTSRGGIAPTIEGWSLGAQDRWVSREVVQAMRATRPALTIVSFPELAIVDQYAPPSNRNAMVSQLTASLDRDIGEIVRETEREKIYSRTVFVVTSGRAMSAITSSVPTQRLSSAVVAAGGEPQYISGDLTASI
ncbi:MAG TPA: alkaline phosphatase family protein, partial [Chloroflexota bacterium]